MATFTNNCFKPRKNSGYVVKFRLTPDKAYEEKNARKRAIARGEYFCDWELTQDFHKTFYIRKTFNSIAGIKNSTYYFTGPWYHGKDIIAFIYKVNDYDFPCAAYVNGKFVELNNLSDEVRDLYCTYSGSYAEDVNPLWVYKKEWR